MARSNIQQSQFNPSALRPAGEPSVQPYGVGSGPDTQSMIVQTPMIGPDGRTFIQQVVRNPDGTSSQPQFISKSPDGGTVSYRQGQDGQWTEGNWTKDSFAQTLFGDKKLMAFLAIAGGVGAYAAASGAAGGAGGAMLGSGTGATPGVVAGGTMGTPGLAGAGAASGALSGAGGGPQWTGEGDTIPPGSNIPGGPPVTPPAGSNVPDWLSKLGGNVPDWLKPIIGGIGSNYIANRQQQQQQEIARQYADKITSASQQAADMSKFTPYNISGGLSTVRSDGNGGVTASLDPRLKAIQDQAIGQAGGFLGSVNAGTPEQLAQQSYGAYNAWAKPQQNQMFAGLQDRLARQGLIGLSVNTQALPQTANSGPTLGVQGGTAADFAPGGKFGNGQQPQTMGVNPYYKDFAQGVALADLKNYENSIRFGQEVTNNQLNMGKGFLGVGVGLDDINREYLNMSGKFGESNMRAGQVAGNFLVNGAQGAASVVAGQANDAAKADAERNKALWDSLFKNVF